MLYWYNRDVRETEGFHKNVSMFSAPWLPISSTDDNVNSSQKQLAEMYVDSDHLSFNLISHILFNQNQ